MGRLVVHEVVEVLVVEQGSDPLGLGLLGWGVASVAHGSTQSRRAPNRNARERRGPQWVPADCARLQNKTRVEQHLPNSNHFVSLKTEPQRGC